MRNQNRGNGKNIPDAMVVDKWQWQLLVVGSGKLLKSI